MPMCARDSLISMRQHKTCGSLPEKKKRNLPIDDLKAKIQAKRQKIEESTTVVKGDANRSCLRNKNSTKNSSCNESFNIKNPLSSLVNTNRNSAISLLQANNRPVFQNAKKQVRFDMNRNLIYLDISTLTEEDVENIWISAEDQDRIRHENLRTIAAFRSNRMDQIDDCLRGLELHSSPELVEKKLQNGRQFCACILEQQAFLQGLMGRANEMILGRMSAVLSAEDGKEAAHTAHLDAREATIIYAESLLDSSKSQKQLEASYDCPVGADITQDFMQDLRADFGPLVHS